MTPEQLEKMKAGREAARLNPKPKKLGMRKAINDYCKGCIYDPLAGGTWRQQVEACTIPKCSLYPFRPVSYSEETGHEAD